MSNPGLDGKQDSVIIFIMDLGKSLCMASTVVMKIKETVLKMTIYEKSPRRFFR
jgi:hypothetical protein